MEDEAQLVEELSDVDVNSTSVLVLSRRLAQGRLFKTKRELRHAVRTLHQIQHRWQRVSTSNSNYVVFTCRARFHAHQSDKCRERETTRKGEYQLHLDTRCARGCRRVGVNAFNRPPLVGHGASGRRSHSALPVTHTLSAKRAGSKASNGKDDERGESGGRERSHSECVGHAARATALLRSCRRSHLALPVTHTVSDKHAGSKAGNDERDEREGRTSGDRSHGAVGRAWRAVAWLR